MRLVSLDIQDYRVLRNVKIDFDRKVQEVYDIHQNYSLDFLAGVNGTGKTTVLQLLARLFQTLLSTNYRFSIPTDLIYEIRGDNNESIMVRVTNRKDTGDEDEARYGDKLRYKINDEDDWQTQKIRPEFLPKNIIIYTTGNEDSWLSELSRWTELISEGEGVADATKEDERYLQEIPGHTLQKIQDEDDFESNIPAMFIRENQFALVTLCGLLASRYFQEEDKKEILEPVLDSIGLQALKGFSLRIRSHKDLTSPAQFEVIAKLEEAANQIIQMGADRLFVFNTNLNDGSNIPILSAYNSPIELFQHLNMLYQHQPYYDSPIQEINIFLNKTSVTETDEEEQQTTMLQLFDWLSDGERSFLGRMALFTLFRDNNLLILLDEPEVHFNDVWKREVVQLLDKIMSGCSSHAVISTHSSIALTDVRQEDILVFRRLGQFVEGSNAVKQPAIPTLGADPSDIMVHVFGTQFASGTRSVSYIRRKISEAKNVDELDELSNFVAPGYWYYRVQLEMEQFGEQKLQ